MRVQVHCRCGELRERSATRQERAAHARMWHESKSMHRLYHAFIDKFQVRLKGKPDAWRWSGYAMSERVYDWARHRKQVRIVGCDDSVFAGSDLVFIPHALKDSYMGTSVIYIPQCTDEQPIEFFLYPSHHEALLRVLKAIKAEHKHKNGWKD